MQQFNYPTIIYFGVDALTSFTRKLKEKNHRKILVVTDNTLCKLGTIQPLLSLLDKEGLPFVTYADTQPNPREEDVENGILVYQKENCDSLIAFGGGGPMDVAKAIKVRASHPAPLELYDDAKGGDKNITNPMPPLYAIPTTAGTGSEVGRSSVIILNSTGKKTIIFHPSLMPDIAVLEPMITAKLPAHLTAATGMDAFTHNLEAYFAPNFHPMADGVALEGLRLIIEALPKACQEGDDLEARGKMLLAASMGAMAFQKGLGMTHSLAHPLSAEFNTHHGLANAILLPFVMNFLENSELSAENKAKIRKVQGIFEEAGLAKATLTESIQAFVSSLGISFGLSKQGIPVESLSKLSKLAFEDPCHATNMFPVGEKELMAVYKAAF